jgi:hypothetical protein
VIANPLQLSEQVAPSQSLESLRSEAVSIASEQSAERVADIFTRVKSAKAYMREIEASLEAALIDWIEEHGDLQVCEKRYYVGRETKVSCTDKAGAIEAILRASYGDVATLLGVLCSEPFKPGATLVLVGPEAFQQCFASEVTKDLKTGKPKRVLKQVNPMGGGGVA